MASYLLAGASLLAVANAGQAVISNNCNFDVYYVAKVNGFPNNVQTFSPGASPLTFPYPSANGPGWAVQFSPNYQSVVNEENISQLEVSYTLPSGAITSPTIWYDLSNVNSSAAGAATAVSTYPFAQWGFTLSSSQQGCGNGATNNCEACGCAAGETDCTAAYQFYNDDSAAMHDTTPDSNVQLELCSPFGSGSSSGSSISGAISSAVSAASPATTPMSTFAGSAATTMANNVNFAANAAASAATSAPAAASSAASQAAGNVFTTTIIKPAVVTTYVTGPAPHAHKRHEHLHHHAHR